MSGSLWPVNPTYLTFPCCFARSSASIDPARLEVTLRIVVVHALVNLPEVEIIGAQASQRLLELAHRHLRVAPMRADLRHQEHLVAPVFNCAAHPLFAVAVVVFPRVVQEIHARVERRVHDAHRLSNGVRHPQVISAETDDGYEVGIASERTTGDGLHFPNIMREGLSVFVIYQSSNLPICQFQCLFTSSFRSSAALFMLSARCY